MDDFSINTLHGSKNEWCCKLISILTPLIVDGYRSILNEAIKLCNQNEEQEKYLMTFQNFISRVPKWNQTIVDAECKRICEKSGCVYLEDLITCVHIIQVKTITAMRVGQKQKKININIPKLSDFIHKVYINVARKMYKNIYLYELSIAPLQAQKNNREIELIINECILDTIRDSIPIEEFLKIYMDECIEEDVTQEINEEVINEPIKPAPENTTPPENKTPLPVKRGGSGSIPSTEKIKFNDIDYVKDSNNVETKITAPKTIDRLEKISELRNNSRKEDSDDDDEIEKIRILDGDIKLNDLDVHVLDEPKMELLPDLLLDDIIVLS